MDPADDLLAFVDASPTPFHAVAEMARRLEADGFRRLDERDRWTLVAGDRVYVVRSGSIAALRVGRQAPADAGLRLVGAHIDSPTLRVRPRPDVQRAGWRLLGVEPYGGVLLHTWLDRDLTVAGRVVVRRADGCPAARLLRVPRAPLRVPSLAIHLQRELSTEGLRLDPQRHVVPLWQLDGKPDAVEPAFVAALADALEVADDDVLSFDVVTTDSQPAARGGADGLWLSAPRLDNLASCHAALCALLASPPSDATQVVVANDHEEVGSRSAQGAAGPFLADVLDRLAAAIGDTDPQARGRAVARSLLVSADAAHAVHPNHVERHEPDHRPRLGGGPVLKVNANQAYATDAATAADVALRAAEAGVALQVFVSRADLPCGSTIGPLTATRLGIPTADVGAPLLAMHSCREMAGAADVGAMVALLTAHLAAL